MFKNKPSTVMMVLSNRSILNLTGGVYFYAKNQKMAVHYVVIDTRNGIDCGMR
jgi:hypothetical protein